MEHQARILTIEDHDIVVWALAAGANGFLSTRAPMAIVSGVMRLVLNGGRYLSATLKEAIIEKYLMNPFGHVRYRHN
jgi:DNA-binding NarL/FixJ family response regulator